MRKWWKANRGDDMKYRLAQFLLQKEIYNACTGKAVGFDSAKEFQKEIIGNPASQFKYCWQSTVGKRTKDVYPKLQD
jgi:hypothetical protein